MRLFMQYGIRNVCTVLLGKMNWIIIKRTSTLLKQRRPLKRYQQTKDNNLKAQKFSLESKDIEM